MCGEAEFLPRRSSAKERVLHHSARHLRVQNRRRDVGVIGIHGNTLNTQDGVARKENLGLTRFGCFELV